MFPVESDTQRCVGQGVQGTIGRERPVRDRRNATNRRRSVAQVLLHPGDPVTRPRFDGERLLPLLVGEIGLPLLPLGHSAEDTDGQTTGGAPGQLGGAEYARGIGYAGKGRIVRRVAVWIATDSAAVKEMIAGRQRSIEDPGVLDEERSAFLEEGFEGRQIDDGGIGLDLTEIGIDGRIEGELAADPVADVNAGARVELGAIEKGVTIVGRAGERAAQRVRTKLQTLGGTVDLDPFENGKLADQTLLQSRDQGELGFLIGAKPAAIEVDAPYLSFSRRFVPHLRQGNADFDRPAQ